MHYDQVIAQLRLNGSSKVSGILYRKAPTVKTGYCSVSDAVDRIAIAENSKAFVTLPGVETPFYLRTYKGRRVGAIRMWSKRQDCVELEWDEVEVPSHVIAQTEEDWLRRLAALEKLVQLVLDGFVVGRIEPAYSLAQDLNHTSAHWLRRSRITAYCTSRIRLNHDYTQPPALISINVMSLDAAMGNNSSVHQQSNPQGSKAAALRREETWSNGGTRALTSVERDKLKNLISTFCELVAEEFPNANPPRFSAPRLTAFFASAANLPVCNAGPEDNGAVEGRTYIAEDTLKRHLRQAVELTKLWADKGAPRKDNLELQARLILRLKNIQAFEKPADILEAANKIP